MSSITERNPKMHPLSHKVRLVEPKCQVDECKPLIVGEHPLIGEWSIAESVPMDWVVGCT